MIKVVIITNIPSPYRVDLFYFMQTNLHEYDINIVYANWSEDNRIWSVDARKLINSHFLNTKIIAIKGKEDTRYIHVPRKLGSKLKELSPDIVIAWEYGPLAIQALLWCKLHKKKYINLTDGTLHSERNIGIIQKITRRIIIYNADAFIASSTKSKEKLLAWGASESFIFISLLTENINRYSCIEKKPVKGRILYVGSMIERKGLDLLIHALPLIQCKYELHIVGNGTKEDVDKLQKQADDKKVSGKISWCGFKEGPELWEEYSQASAFVLPTREDCFGLVLLEAACARIPIVASKYADGAYDIITHGENGYIVDPFDCKKLASALTKALNEMEIPINKSKSLHKFQFLETVKGYINALEFCNKSNMSGQLHGVKDKRKL